MKKAISAVVILITAIVKIHAASGFSSCKELRLNSTKPLPSGVYTLYDSSHGVPYETYCDMLSNGGGWTLVASIHENNIESSGYCTLGDRWSSEQGFTETRPRGDGNWANYKVFGNVLAATSDDFKNPGYFDITADDIMIWHVPNDTPVSDWRKSAYLRYRSDEGQLADEGGNLFELFNDYQLISGVYNWPSDAGPDFEVVFDEGSVSEVMLHQAPNLVPYVQPGYIQLRVPNFDQDVLALCPGIRLDATHDHGLATHGCVGSTGKSTNVKFCGDFAGMAYSGVGAGTSWSVDKILIETTFLVFYR